MTPSEAVNAIDKAVLVECNAEEYPDIRKALHQRAREHIDAHDPRAVMMLAEIKRLDSKFHPRNKAQCG